MTGMIIFIIYTVYENSEDIAMSTNVDNVYSNAAQKGQNKQKERGYKVYAIVKCALILQVQMHFVIDWCILRLTLFLLFEAKEFSIPYMNIDRTCDLIVFRYLYFITSFIKFLLWSEGTTFYFHSGIRIIPAWMAIHLFEMKMEE